MWKSLEKKIKRATLVLARSTGLFRKVGESRWRRDRLLILCYHGISLEEEHLWEPPLYMTAATFESRLALLKKSGCAVLPLHVGLERLHTGDLPPRSVAITFDDGFYDFYAKAYPLLKKYGFPATVYLTTYYCDDNRPVFDTVCRYILWKGRGQTIGLEGFRQPLDLRTFSGRKTAMAALAELAAQQKLSAEKKDRLAERLAAKLGVNYGELRRKRILHLMSPEEVRNLADGGIDVQLHTHRHRTPLDQELFQREIQDNRRRIKELTGVNSVHFCYPSGVTHPQFLPWLAEQEVVSATTCETGLASRESHSLMLPRVVDTSNLAPVEFEGWLSGVASFLPPHLTRHSPA